MNKSLSHQAVFLDAGSMGQDMSLEPLLELLPKLITYDQSALTQRVERVKDAQIVIVNKVKLNESHFELAKQLKLICLTATGSDNVDIQAATKYGIKVCNVSGYSVDSVPQHALTLMLMLATRIHQYLKDAQDGSWTQANHFALLHHRITELKGKTLGIVGYGSLGQQLHKLVTPFEMKVQQCNLPGRPKVDGRLDFEELLPVVDFLSLHCPLTPLTSAMLGKSQFEKMKSSAFLINTARGQLVDERALANALKRGDIAGAGIDVLSQEPPPLDHPLLDPHVPNLILTPHNAWGSHESRKKLLQGVIANINAFVDGAPTNCLNPT